MLCSVLPDRWRCSRVSTAEECFASPRTQFCFNQCNGRGECLHGFCKCDPGELAPAGQSVPAAGFLSILWGSMLQVPRGWTGRQHEAFLVLLPINILEDFLQNHYLKPLSLSNHHL
jgi:hypothetical protein